MNMWSKLLTAVRGGINEVGENVADSQALRILDQEIRDADEELKKTREALASMIARQRMTEESIKGLAGKIEEYEGYAMKALDKGDEVLGLEVAGKIADLEKERREEAARSDEIAESVASLRKSVSQAENSIKRLRQQIDTVRATESVQKAQMTVARRQGDGRAKLQTAMESLERIKRRQEHTAAEIQAFQVLDGETRVDSLEARLKEAGIIVDEVSPESVLARLKEKKAGLEEGENES
ncbi:PspA/IM30 family protein [Deltaproteobacteria bacterium OttesenSCG-928-M10]|nr:PspA/IM30 family protein [Deltaproteobacteria bacterium OttesenSCG-928-M10]